MREESTVTITEDEAELYDRQIRLWGLEAQNRLRNASILIVGMNGLGAEIAKNIVLAGVKALTLLDSENVDMAGRDGDAQFLVEIDSTGQNRAKASSRRLQQINPMVRIETETGKLADVGDDFFNKFDLICLINQSESAIDRINKICRTSRIKMCAGGVYGWFGYGFMDFLDHEFIDEVKIDTSCSDNCTLTDDDDDNDEDNREPDTKRPRIVAPQQNEPTVVKHTLNFHSWSEAMNVNWKTKRLVGRAKKLLPPSYFVIKGILSISNREDCDLNEKNLRDAWTSELDRCNLDEDTQICKPEQFCHYVSGELSPVCAIVGGIIGQEVIKALSQKDHPLENLFLYSGMDTTGIVCRLPPK